MCPVSVTPLKVWVRTNLGVDEIPIKRGVRKTCLRGWVYPTSRCCWNSSILSVDETLFTHTTNRSTHLLTTITPTVKFPRLTWRKPQSGSYYIIIYVFSNKTSTVNWITLKVKRPPVLSSVETRPSYVVLGVPLSVTTHPCTSLTQP